MKQELISEGRADHETAVLTLAECVADSLTAPGEDTESVTASVDRPQSSA